MSTYYIVEGTTEEQVFQLWADDVALVGTGLTLDLEVMDKFGQAVTLTGTVEWKTQATGVARWLPATGGELVKEHSPYLVRWSLVDAGSKQAYAPNGLEPDRWIIVKP